MSTNTKKGMIIGKPAIDFTLQDHQGGFVTLNKMTKISPAMLVFYPKDFSPVCKSQLCDYRDNIDDFNSFGIQIFGISPNDTESHKKFAAENKFPFLLLSDFENRVAKLYGCSSLFMFGNISRAIFLINTKGIILYRYIEPTTLSRRKSSVLFQVIKQLQDNNLL